MPNLQDYLSFAKQLSYRAGELMRQHYYDKQVISKKLDHTVVSQIDHKINALVIDEVATKFPEHGVNGEEASLRSDSSQLWVCDPIDGTAAYLLHLPTSTFMLSLVDAGIPQVAVVYNPWTGILYHAVRDEGAWHEQRQLQVSSRQANDMAFIGGGGCSTARSRYINSEKGIKLLKARGWHNINVHGIGQKGMMVADGGIDGVLYAHSGAHDVAALDLIVTEAGGKATDLDGNPGLYNAPINGAIISNGHIHNELIDIAKQLRKT